MNIYSGKSVSGGIAIGRITVISPKRDASSPVRTDDCEKGKIRFLSAVDLAKKQIKELYETALKRVGAESAEIFEIHKMMLEDCDFINSVLKTIDTDHVIAEYAVYKTGETFSGMFSEMDNEYMRERSADVIDISQRVISNLSGGGSAGGILSEPTIIVAETLTPSETVQLDRSKILAFVTSKGSVSSHTAILAGVMNIPAIVSADIPVLPALEGHIAAVDAYSGKIYLDPDSALLAPLQLRLDQDKKRKENLDKYRGVPTKTSDGKKIMLLANIGSPEDISSVIKNDAEGVGLFRSEFLYLESNQPPDEITQLKAYSSVAKKLGDKPLIIRTFDLGADKKADYITMEEEENPALGVRGIRLCFEKEELFKTQLRAIYRASAFGNIMVMYPMITSLDEVHRIKKITKEVKKELSYEKIEYNNIKEGIMIETPAAALISDVLAEEVDFFSIGTNDLTQYTLAADRQNPNLDDVYNVVHPSVFKLIELTCKNAHKKGIWVGICGEMGASEEATKRLIAAGIDEFSVSPQKILSLREAISKHPAHSQGVDG